MFSCLFPLAKAVKNRLRYAAVRWRGAAAIRWRSIDKYWHWLGKNIKDSVQNLKNIAKEPA
jgi:hypothetical protein